MNQRNKFFGVILLLAAPLLTSAAPTTSEMSVSPEAQQTYQDMQKTLGIVPTYLKQYPEEGIESGWALMNAIQAGSDTAISAKYKELIGLGVSAQIPCSYCVYYHTEAAILNGATNREIQEAIDVASDTLFWSTWLNGIQMDEAVFKAETSKVVNYLKQQNAKGGAAPSMPTQAITNAQTAHQDIEKTLGVVPQFLRMLPDAVIAPAWRSMKSVYLNPNSAIPSKYKELIGLAVAAQIPCKYCTYFHTESAKLSGALDGEIAEAVLVAANTRKWSTVLNGNQVDAGTFKKETDQIMEFLKQSSMEQKAGAK